MAHRPKSGTVLVVDDVDDARELVSVILSAGGYRVIEAATGQEALARMAESPDLVVLDVELPDIDGFEVCRRIRMDPHTSTTPVVHVSAVFSRTEHRVRGLAVREPHPVRISHPADDPGGRKGPTAGRSRPAAAAAAAAPE